MQQHTFTLSDDDFSNLLDMYWEEIAIFAFSQFTEHGRGAIFLTRSCSCEPPDDGEIELGYIKYTSDIEDTALAAFIEK